MVATTSSFMSSNFIRRFKAGVPSCSVTVPEIIPVLFGAIVGKGVGEAVGDLLRDPIGGATADGGVEASVGEAMGASVGEPTRIAVPLSDGGSSIVKVISRETPATPLPSVLEKGVALKIFRLPGSYGHGTKFPLRSPMSEYGGEFSIRKVMLPLSTKMTEPTESGVVSARTESSVAPKDPL